MFHKRLWIIILSLLTIISCDTWSLIRKVDKTLIAVPKIDCIKSTLQNIKEIEFEYYDQLKSYELSGDKNYIHKYGYKIKKLSLNDETYDRAHLFLETKDNKIFTYTNEYKKPGYKSISQSKGQLIKATMEKVEKALSERCLIKVNSIFKEI